MLVMQCLSDGLWLSLRTFDSLREQRYGTTRHTQQMCPLQPRGHTEQRKGRRVWAASFTCGLPLAHAGPPASTRSAPSASARTCTGAPRPWTACLGPHLAHLPACSP